MTMLNQTFTQDPLQVVVEQFEEWRRTRKHGRETIPDRLWLSVQALGNQYTPVQLAKTLRVNYNQLKRNLHHKTEAKLETVTFVECASTPTWPVPTEKECSITFICKHGRPVTVNGLHGATLSTAISTLIGG